MKLEFSPQIFGEVNLIKIRPVIVELFHADKQTDMKLITAFRNFGNAPNNFRLMGYDAV
jgi:hypothetical protein